MYISLASIPQDYSGGFFGTGPKVLSLFGDTPKSSDRETGEAHFKHHSSCNDMFSNKDGVKDPGSEKTVFNAA